jgi:gp16 family phage-associated protein
MSAVPTPLTPMQLKRKLWAEGSSLKQWAEDNGYKYQTVSSVVNGKIKVKRPYGQGFEIATKLGLVVEAANGELLRAKVAA